MSYTFEQSKDNKAVFILTIPKEIVKEEMKKVATSLSHETKIPGFRPGMAPYETIASHYGEMKLLDMVTETLVQEALVEALSKEQVKTLGQPFFHAEKMVPNDDLIMRVEIAIYPSVTDLASPEKHTISKKSCTPSETEIENTLQSIVHLRTKESPATTDHTLTMGDKAVVLITMKKDGVVIEGGEEKEQTIYTNESFYIPHFIDNIIGLKAGEEKEFTLTFPETYHKKDLANTNILFHIIIKSIALLEKPELNDVFAQSLGISDMNDLKKQIMENLKTEKEGEETQRQHTEMLQALVNASHFENIPDILVNQEINKMISELNTHITESGGNFDDYLKQIKKSLADLKLDFSPNAIMRIKSSILLSAYGKKYEIVIPQEDVKNFIESVSNDPKDAQEALKNPHYIAFITERLLQKEVLKKLQDIMVV